MADDKKTYDVTVKQLPKSEVEFSGSITAETFDSYRARAVASLGSDLTIPGFRKGKAPEAIIVQRFGEDAVLEEMAQFALNAAYPQMLEEHNIDAIGNPQVSIKKIAIGNPLEFTLKTAVMPKVKLGDYKKAARAENKKDITVTVEETEVENAVLDIRRRIAPLLKAKEEEKKAEEGAPEAAVTDVMPEVENTEKKEETVPELTDEAVQKLGEFKTVAEFREKVREGIQKEKEQDAIEARRKRIVESVTKDSAVEIPEVLIENELNRMMSQLKHDLSHISLSFEDYLSKVKKTEEELLKEWREAAEQKVKVQLVFEAIIEAESITIPEEELVHELSHAREHYPNANPRTLRNTIENALLNEKFFAFLDGQKEEK